MKGLIWHRGKFHQYTTPFKENETTTVGLLYDGPRGTLSYFKDGVSLGVAFTDVTDEDEGGLYPAICSTAAKTQMILGRTLRSFDSLKDRCRVVIARSLRTPAGVDALPLPAELRKYVRDSVPGWAAGDEAEVSERKKAPRQLHGVGMPLSRRRAQQQLVY